MNISKRGEERMDKEEKEMYEKTIDWINHNIFQYNNNMIASPYLRKRIKELAYNKDGEQMYTFKMILYAVMTHADEIKWAFSNKDFKNESHKINYLMVVIGNDMNNIKSKVLEHQRQQQIATQQMENAQVLADNNVLLGSNRYIRKTEDISERLKDLWKTEN